MEFLYKHTDTRGSSVVVSKFGIETYEPNYPQYGPRVNITADYAPDLAQAILKAAYMQAWIVEKRDPETLTYWFPVVDGQIVCELGRITPSKARELAAEFLRAADVADAQEPAKERLADLYEQQNDLLGKIEEAEKAVGIVHRDPGC